MVITYEKFLKTYPESYRKSLFYPKLLELKKRGFSFSEVKKLLSPKLPFHILYRWYKGKTVPLPFKDFSRIKKEFNDKDLEKLAVIVGHILGDGGINKKKILHYCNTEKFLIEEFKSCVRDVFHIKPMCEYREKSGIIRLRYPRVISRVLLCLFGEFSLGNKKKITRQIDRMPLWWKIKLIQALYNDEGSVVISNSYKAITLKQKSKSILEWIRKVLRSVNVNSTICFDGRCWQLRILNYINMRRFSEKVNFSKGYRKRVKLQQLLKKFKCPKWETKIEILKLLKEKKRSVNELARRLRLKPGTICGHFHGWKRRGRESTKGLVDMKLVEVRKVGRKNYYCLSPKVRLTNLNFRLKLFNQNR